VSECCELQVRWPSWDRATPLIQAASVGNLCLTRSLGAGNLEINQTRPLPLRASFVLLWAFLTNCMLDLSVSSVQSETRGLESGSRQQEHAEMRTWALLGLTGVNLAVWQYGSRTLKMFLSLLGISEMGSSISIH